MKNKVLFWISVVMQTLQVCAAVVAVSYALHLNMIPDKYIGLLVVAFSVLVLATGLLMFLRGKNPVSLPRRIVAWLIVLATIFGCVLLAKVLGDLRNTVDTITTTIISEETRDVYVVTDDPAQTLQDAAEYTFAVVEGYDEENTQLAMNTITRELGHEINVQKYATVFEMIDGLYAGQVGAIILNSGYITILEEYPDYQDFLNKTRMLYAAALEIPVPPTTLPPETEPPVTEPEPTEPPSVTNTPFVVYISGSDTRSTKLYAKTRSDVNILAVINPNTHQVLLLNTPRDYYVQNPAGGGAMDKLTHCGVYGIDCSVEALEILYDIPIEYYAQINFTGFETLIDAIGGVTVYADQSFSAGVDYYFQEGENTLDGKAALSFARERYHVSGGDRGRGKNQMKVISAVIKKMTSGATVISRYSEILESLEGMFTTSFPMEDVNKLIKMQLDEMPSWEIYSFAVSGRTGSDRNYSMPGLYASVMYQDKELVAQASELVKRVLANEEITNEDVKPVK